MSHDDRVRWDARYAADRGEDAVGLAAEFRSFEATFPTTGHALDVACGGGSAGVWLARHGLDVMGLDVSPVAVNRANALARTHGVADRCRFGVTDLDDGLPAGLPLDVVVCQRFRDARLDRAIVARLPPGGILAISALSEVGAQPGRYRVAAGELTRSFRDLEILAEGEGAGVAWLLARRPGRPSRRALSR